MAQLAYFVSTVLMGLFLLAVAVSLARGGGWRQYRVDDRRSTSDALARVAGSPTAWTVGFLLLVFVSAATAVLFVSGAGVPESIKGAVGFVLAGVGLSVLAAYLVFGIYRSARYRGLKSAQAAAASVWVLGLLFVLAVVLKLTVGS
ncbi:hypothetical protein [Halegenticoccus soli]|uniref:hypothetical protein n=1 Tax=Halegenticoccus soli TaxID=1985678 RepID=UPI000C6E6597|nr:hypothetical protein [Halegenticoccus soli]